MNHTKTVDIENVVASTEIDQELDLQSLSADFDAMKYNPDQFPGLVYRMQDPQVASLIFRSGKIVCTGAKSIEAVHTALERVITEFREVGVHTGSAPEITVQNIVSSADLEQRLNLNAIAVGLGLENIEYEPEQFPGLVYRLDEPDVVGLLFGSGKLVITGGRERVEAEQALAHIESELDTLGLLD